MPTYDNFKALCGNPHGLAGACIPRVQAETGKELSYWDQTRPMTAAQARKLYWLYNGLAASSIQVDAEVPPGYTHSASSSLFLDSSASFNYSPVGRTCRVSASFNWTGSASDLDETFDGGNLVATAQTIAEYKHNFPVIWMDRDSVEGSEEFYFRTGVPLTIRDDSLTYQYAEARWVVDGEGFDLLRRARFLTSLYNELATVDDFDVGQGTPSVVSVTPVTIEGIPLLEVVVEQAINPVDGVSATITLGDFDMYVNG